MNVGRLAFERNCMLYVDAEQTFMQAAIESFGQQMTHTFNVGEKHIMMNGYQCYLKRMPHVIPMEVETSKRMGYNLGLKLIRGAYLTEERELADKLGVESPVHDTLEDTHNSYNSCLKEAVSNVGERGLVFIACHNKDSIEIAKQMMQERGLSKERVRFG